MNRLESTEIPIKTLTLKLVANATCLLNQMVNLENDPEVITQQLNQNPA